MTFYMYMAIVIGVAILAYSWESNGWLSAMLVALFAALIWPIMLGLMLAQLIDQIEDVRETVDILLDKVNKES